MPLAAQILAGLAAAIHVFFFYLESIAWRKPSTWRTFGLKSQDEAEVTHGLALNQGFYNLFLAIGVFVGIVLHATAADSVAVGDVASAGEPSYEWSLPNDFVQRFWGEASVVFGLACMLGAALVLLVSSKGKMVRGAAIQGLAPAAALLIIALA